MTTYSTDPCGLRSSVSPSCSSTTVNTDGRSVCPGSMAGGGSDGIKAVVGRSPHVGTAAPVGACNPHHVGFLFALFFPQYQTESILEQALAHEAHLFAWPCLRGLAVDFESGGSHPVRTPDQPILPDPVCGLNQRRQGRVGRTQGVRCVGDRPPASARGAGIAPWVRRF